MDLGSVGYQLEYLVAKSDNECFDFLETLTNHEINLIYDNAYNRVYQFSSFINKIEELRLDDFEVYLWEKFSITISKFNSFDNIIIDSQVPIEEWEIKDFDKGAFLYYIDYLEKLYRVTKLINTFIESRRENEIILEKENNFPEKVKQIKKNEINHITDILEKASYWIYLKKELADKKLIDINTGIVIDEKKGTKKVFISLIKYLHSKGYYRNMEKPSNKEIITILKNTFGISTSIDSCKSTNFDYCDYLFDSLLYASQIE